MIVHNFDPVLIDFSVFEIRWYSLAYIFGILSGWFYGKSIIKKNILLENKKLYLDNFDDLVGYIIIGVIVGGRLGYVIFYDPKFYFYNFSETVKIWNGGMSFHGGLVGVIIAIYLFSNFKNLNYKIYFDTICCVAPIGLFLGRIANFINSELYGVPTEKFWGVIFPKVDNISRHPSQIYEAFLEGLVLFVILNFLIAKKSYRQGFISSIFLILYGIFRITSEYFREPDQNIGYIFGYLSMGTLLSIIMILFGILLLSKINFNEKNR
tara:strand:- start:10781 stop:11578 length:798 start_codon:yes stop_codon:yes gene_type:complete